MSDQPPGAGADSKARTVLAIAGAVGLLLAIAVIVLAVIIRGTAAALMLSVLAALIGVAALAFMRYAGRR